VSEVAGEYTPFWLVRTNFVRKGFLSHSIKVNMLHNTEGCSVCSSQISEGHEIFTSSKICLYSRGVLKLKSYCRRWHQKIKPSVL
jgi:hypothetical protein